MTEEINDLTFWWNDITIYQSRQNFMILFHVGQNRFSVLTKVQYNFKKTYL